MEVGGCEKERGGRKMDCGGCKVMGYRTMAAQHRRGMSCLERASRPRASIDARKHGVGCQERQVRTASLQETLDDKFLLPLTPQ